MGSSRKSKPHRVTISETNLTPIRTDSVVITNIGPSKKYPQGTNNFMNELSDNFENIVPQNTNKKVLPASKKREHDFQEDQKNHQIVEDRLTNRKRPLLQSNNSYTNQSQPNKSAIHADSFTLRPSQRAMAKGEQDSSFKPCHIVHSLGSNKYLVQFDENRTEILDRSSIIVNSFTDFHLGAILPKGQKVLVKCHDGFFYPGIISKVLPDSFYSIIFLDEDGRPSVHRKDIVLDGEPSIVGHQLQVCQKVLAKYPSEDEAGQKINLRQDSYSTAFIISQHTDERYTVAFSKNLTKLVYSKDVTLSHKSFLH